MLISLQCAPKWWYLGGEQGFSLPTSNKLQKWQAKCNPTGDSIERKRENIDFHCFMNSYMHWHFYTHPYVKNPYVRLYTSGLWIKSEIEWIFIIWVQNWGEFYSKTAGLKRDANMYLCRKTECHINFSYIEHKFI